MDIETMRENLRGREVPALLKALVEFDEDAGGYFAGDFELLEDGAGTAEAWWGDKPQLAEQFLMFGHDGMHSLYGYWLYDGRTLENAPIVYLNGEASDNTVLANSLEEFLSLLGRNFELLGLYARDFEGEEFELSNEEAVAAFRAFLEEKGIPAKDPREIVEEARASHPDLDEWVSAQLS